MSNGVTVTLTAGRAYSTASISAIVNTTVGVSNDLNHALHGGGGNAGWETAKNPGITASMDGYNLVLSSSVTGSSGTISVAANTFATQFLGLQSGKVTGSGGENAILEGSVDVSGGIIFAKRYR